MLLCCKAYQRNEKAFEHDLKRYWDRMGQALTKLPTWQGEPVKLFTLFSAVNDRGGYDKVNRYFLNRELFKII